MIDSVAHPTSALTPAQASARACFLISKHDTATRTSVLNQLLDPVSQISKLLLHVLMVIFLINHLPITYERFMLCMKWIFFLDRN